MLHVEYNAIVSRDTLLSMAEVEPPSNANEEETIFVAIRIRPLTLNDNEIIARPHVSAWNCTHGNTIRCKHFPAERERSSSSVDAYTFGNGGINSSISH